jgi:hypothetical protein
MRPARTVGSVRAERFGRRPRGIGQRCRESQAVRHSWPRRLAGEGPIDRVPPAGAESAVGGRVRDRLVSPRTGFGAFGVQLDRSLCCRLPGRVDWGARLVARGLRFVL